LVDSSLICCVFVTDESTLLLSARLQEIEEIASEMEFCRVILGLWVQIGGRGLIGPDPSHGARLVGTNGNLGLCTPKEQEAPSSLLGDADADTNTMDEYELLVGGVCMSSGATSPLWLCASSILITSACEGEACNDERAEFMYVPSSRSGEEERDESNSNSNDCMVSPGEVVRAVGL